MSHDEHSRALAAWLDAESGAPPPTALDDDVVEAILALRPDRAPPARVSADDILALVEEGPLAQPREADVVPFPGAQPAPEAVDKSTPNPPPRWSSLARWGGASGIGLAIAAAATLMLVALPTLQVDQAPQAQGEAAPVADELRAPAAAAPAEPAPADTGAVKVTQKPPKPAAKPSRKASPRPSPPPQAAPPPPAASAEVLDEPAYDMGGAPVAERALIPELAEEVDTRDGVAAADVPAQPQAEVDLDALRAAAQPPDYRANDWQGRVPTADRDRVQALLDSSDEAAAAGDLTLAADLAARGIAPPAAAAQAAALVAFDRYRAASDTTAAISAAQRGLQYRTNTPAWSALAVRLGDLLRSTDPDAAAQWYRDASAFNQTR